MLNLDGSRFVKDRVDNLDLSIPMTTDKHLSTFLVSNSDDELILPDEDLQTDNKNRSNLKRKRTQSDADSLLLPPPPPPPSQEQQSLSPPLSTGSMSANTSTSEILPLLRHYAHVCGVNINETLLENAELCGTNLAVKLMQMGADSILEEIQQHATVIPTP